MINDLSEIRMHDGWGSEVAIAEDPQGLRTTNHTIPGLFESNSTTAASPYVFDDIGDQFPDP